MRLPFLKKKPAQNELITPGYPPWDNSFRSPMYEYTPSDVLQLVIHLPVNGFVHSRPSRDTSSRSDTPGQYDHILNGELEVIAPPDWCDRVETIIVGYRVSCKLNPGKGRQDEVDTLFERQVALEGDTSISPGSQSFTFSLILPSTLPAHDFHRNPFNGIVHKAYAQLVSTSSSPPTAVSSTHDYFSRDLKMSPTLITVTPMSDGLSKVVYGGYTRMRVIHMTENDATFVSLDHAKQGFVEAIGVYDYRILSDVFRMRLPSLSPLITLFYVRMYLTQYPSIRSPRDPITNPPFDLKTTQFILAEFGEKPPPGHVHPATHTKALWRGTEAGGKGTGDGWEGQIIGRLPDDDELRPSTVTGIITPIEVRHTLSVEFIFSVYGEFANGNRMSPSGPGALRAFRTVDDLFLPACVNIPDMLKLPTYEESSSELRQAHCACRLPAAEVEKRMRQYVEMLRRGDAERAEVGRNKNKAAAGSEST